MFPEHESLKFCDCCHHRLLPEDEKKWNGLCRVCATEALQAFKRLLWGMRPSERKLLNDLFDGVDFLSGFMDVRLRE